MINLSQNLKKKYYFILFYFIFAKIVLNPKILFLLFQESNFP